MRRAKETIPSNPESKTCVKCGRHLPIAEFGVQRATPDGRKYECKDCGRVYMAEYRRTHRAEMLEYQRKYMTKPEAAELKRVRDHDYYHSDPDAAKSRILKRLFGISIEQYNEMLAAQGGGCKICGATEGDTSGRALAVDHHHGTGNVRGLLCSKCNQAIGLFKDDPELLARAITYLLETT